MKKLYKLEVRHYAPKYYHDSVEGFIIAESKFQAFQLLGKDELGLYYFPSFESYKKNSKDEEMEYKTEEEYFNSLEQEYEDDFYKDDCVDDLYYGATVFSLTEVGNALDSQIDFLKNVGLLLVPKKHD